MKFKIDYIFLVVSSNHNGMYEKFGGVSLVNRLDSYKGLKQQSDVLCWEPKKSMSSPYFVENILNKKKLEMVS
jgi:hypothetical protein